MKPELINDCSIQERVEAFRLNNQAILEHGKRTYALHCDVGDDMKAFEQIAAVFNANGRHAKVRAFRKLHDLDQALFMAYAFLGMQNINGIALQMSVERDAAKN
jgi:hypothetical protein